MSLLVIQKWAEIIGQARQSVDVLKDQEVIRTVLNILQVCISQNGGILQTIDPNSALLVIKLFNAAWL